MEIQELIEQIAASGKEYGMFYIIMEDTNAPMYSTVVDCRGKEFARCDYFGLSTETKFIPNTDDAIAFLFDCDIHLWELVKCCRTCVLNSQHVRWNITLRR